MSKRTFRTNQGSGGSIDPSTTSEFFDDFVGANYMFELNNVSGNVVGIMSAGQWGFSGNSTVTDSPLQNGSDVNHPGVVNMGPGAPTYFYLTGSAGIGQEGGIGQVSIGDIYQFSAYHDLITAGAAVGIIGLGNDMGPGGATNTPIIYFSWTQATGLLAGVVAGVGSTAGVAITGSQFNSFKIIVSSGSVEFFLNGVSMGSVAGALPTDAITPFIRGDQGGLTRQLDMFYFRRTLTR